MQSLEPCAVCRCSVADVELNRHVVTSDYEQVGTTTSRAKERESDAEFYVAAVPCGAPSPAVLRRRPRHRDVVAPADFYRASTTLTETRCRSYAAVAQVAEAAAVARSVVNVAVVCCVSCVLRLVLLFGTSSFPVTLLAFV